MPVASPEIYAEMLDRAKSGGFAYPAINCTSSQTVNAALRGFAEAESDGIIQVSWGGANFASGASINNMVDGAIALAEFARVAAKNYLVNVALHGPLPAGQAGRVHAATAATRGRARQARRGAVVPVAHVGW